MLYPLTFHPLVKERIWGGRRLSTLYGKPLPPDVRIGESWEISDRPGDESIVAHGPLQGRSLRWLMEHHGADILGDAAPAAGGRFPLLCKILDARDRLSLQVHPPASKAGALGGEPKTEMWYIAEADPDAELFVGLRRGVTREEFQQKVTSGEVAGCFHRIPVRAGDTMFLPSGRVHAIGAGLVIFEIQQNSDTTYRVFDWNRVDRDGRARELHVEQSLASIDFGDFEPSLVDTPWKALSDTISSRVLVHHTLFGVDLLKTSRAAQHTVEGGRLRVIAIVGGGAHVSAGGVTIGLHPGQFVILPAVLGRTELVLSEGARWLMVEGGQ